MNRIAIIGSGNIGLALARGLVHKSYCKAIDITLTRRSLSSFTVEADEGFSVSIDNKEAVSNARIIILAVLPQQLNDILSEIKESVNAQEQLFVSIVSGAKCADIREKLDSDVQVIRAMPNTAIAVGQSMTCIASDNALLESMDEIAELFEMVGSVVKINEELMTSATALCACGIAFFLRSIRAASQGGVEIGFHADEALKMAVQTAKGAAELLSLNQSHPESEIDKVTSPKGCTIAGLNEMEHHGFSSSMIKGIKLSALKADGLYKAHE